MPLDVPPPRVMVLHHTEKLTFLAICVDVLDRLGTSLYLWRSILAAVCANLSFLGMEVSKMSECNGVVHQQQSLSLLCSCDDLYIPLRQIPSSCILLKSLVLLVITPRFVHVGPSLSHPISSSLVLQLFFFQVTIYDKAGPSVGFAVSKQQAIDELEALLGQICFQFHPCSYSVTLALMNHWLGLTFLNRLQSLLSHRVQLEMPWMLGPKI